MQLYQINYHKLHKKKTENVCVCLSLKSNIGWVQRLRESWFIGYCYTNPANPSKQNTNSCHGDAIFKNEPIDFCDIISYFLSCGDPRLTLFGWVDIQ